MRIHTLQARDVLSAMIHNADALKRLLLAHDDLTLDPERSAAYQDILDEIATRELRHTARLNELLLRAGIERRVSGERRQGHERRQPQGARSASSS
jgi:hypothetical protein